MTKKELLKTPQTICGRPVVDYVRVKGTDIILPVIETETDIQWVEGCIKDREEHPEKYPDEDIPAVLARSKELLRRLREEERVNCTITPKGKAYLEGTEAAHHVG